MGFFIYNLRISEIDIKYIALLNEKMIFLYFILYKI